MEKVYESFVSIHIVDIFEREDHSVSTQDTGRYFNGKKIIPIYSPRPDIVIEDENGNTIIMET